MLDEGKQPGPVKASVLFWRDAKSTPLAFFRAACARLKWNASEQSAPTEVSEADYDEAIRAVQFDRL